MAMPARVYNIVEGTSLPYRIQLENNEAAFDASGIDIDIEVYLNGTIISTNPPTVTWDDQTSSTIFVDGIESLTPGEYHVRYKLTYSNGDIDYLPSGPNIVESDRFVIKPRYA